jgi:hypothetical protein
LACSVRSAKTACSAEELAFSAFACVLAAGFQSLIFKSENGFVIRAISI